MEEGEGEEVCPLMKGVGIGPKRADFYSCHLYRFGFFLCVIHKDQEKHLSEGLY